MRHRRRDPSSRPESPPYVARARTATHRDHGARSAARAPSDRGADARDSESLRAQCGGRNVTGAKAPLAALAADAALTRPACSLTTRNYRSDGLMCPLELVTSRVRPDSSSWRTVRRSSRAEVAEEESAEVRTRLGPETRSRAAGSSWRMLSSSPEHSRPERSDH